jgi:acyl-CoA thioesterase I
MRQQAAALQGAFGASPVLCGGYKLYREILLIAIFALICCSCGGNKSQKDENAGELPPASRDRDLRPVIAAFGNSLTAGQGVDQTRNYPCKLQAQLDKAGYQYRVVNSGISGETSSQGLDRIQSISALHPSIVILEFGANDGLRGLPAETTRRNLAAMISHFQSTGSKVMLAGMRIPPNYGPQYTESFRNIFPSLAKEYHASLIPFFLEGVGGRPELNQEDGIHPTAEGYDVIVENVWKALQPLL